MIKLKESKRTLANGEMRNGCCILELDVDKKIEVPNEVLFYIELKDKIITLLNWYQAQHLYDISRNIFCYDKNTGELLWQVDQPKYPSGKLMDTMYVNIWVEFQERDGSYKTKGKSKPKGDNTPGWRIYTEKSFRPGIDKLKAATFSCDLFYIDIQTGKVEWFGYTK